MAEITNSMLERVGRCCPAAGRGELDRRLLHPRSLMLPRCKSPAKASLRGSPVGMFPRAATPPQDRAEEGRR